jgi:hypothetical protein
MKEGGEGDWVMMPGMSKETKEIRSRRVIGCEADLRIAAFV